MRFPRFQTSLAAVALAALSPGAFAAGLGDPASEVILTVTGEIATTNRDDAAVFDLDMLTSMNTVTYETETIWTDGVQTFTGVLLSDLMDRLGAEGSSLSAMAINDYAVEIPSSDWVETGPIIAYHQNGAPMSVRDKGPLWIIYPYDDNDAYQSEVIYSRSIWQLDRIKVLE
ncbi:molybdopterin-dependent oxidoreductase [Sagittula sp. NFXS13]|uniref:oxidoreductase n=1 Tax=Sagittula sp. NFXS13 TaxID=2819095 RepID=UPI0032DF0B94